MADVHTPEQRSRNMSSIRGKNTKIEVMFRKALWRKGLRYRLKTNLPGKPDIVLSSYKIVIFIDGCFWHGCAQHQNIPATNREFWVRKLNRNKERDIEVNKILRAEGWTVIRIWEHEVKKNPEGAIKRVFDFLTH